MGCASEAFETYSGEDKDLVIRLTTSLNGCSSIYAIDPADAIKVTLAARPTDLTFLNTGVSPRVTVTSEPYGEIKISLTAEETAQLIDGTIVIEVTRAAKKKIFVVDGGIKKLVPSNC